ncbi:MAG: DinB family protein [Ilumatobacteraceae bacterium]
MAEEFEFQDLSGSVFWGVDLRRSTFRDVDLTGARISHARLVDVSVDAEIDQVVINGVDVTAYVNERDEWFTLRSQVRPTDAAGMRQAWHAFGTAWAATIDRARALPDGRVHQSVDAEWSFVETIRHLVFATDKWCTVPILGGSFHPIGLPNTGSAGLDWPDIDTAARPTIDEAAAVWHQRSRALGDHLADLDDDSATLDREVDIIENGATAVRHCIGVVFEEHFEHLRYAIRDLDRLG